jgi:oxygen-independent coproporphyrinogen-3 oxidase
MKQIIDTDILLKYDRPGPRYTSYPPVPHFRSDFTAGHYRAAITASKRTDPISLYFHLPFCRTLCYYCGCNTVITSRPEIKENYLKALHQELQMVRSLISGDRPVAQLHWGGGTPNYFSEEQLRRIPGWIRDAFPFTEDAEVSIELSPSEVEEGQLATLRELGFNRISFGVQDFDERVQEAVNRVQPESKFRRIFAEARTLGFHSINVDLIYGLPYQTVQSYRRTIDTILELSPDRMAVFSYAHVPWVKQHQSLLPADALPAAIEKLLIFKNVVESFTGAGYIYIGLDHFARPEDELARALASRTLYRNFQGYTTRKGIEIFAFGITSISQLERVYVRNVRGLKDYREILSRGELPVHDGYVLSDDDVIRRDVIITLMCNGHLDFRTFEKQYGIDFRKYFGVALQRLQPFIEDGLLNLNEDSLEVPVPGRPIIRNMAMCFDAYLGTEKKTQLYSRTI